VTVVMPIILTIPEEPVAKGRPRLTVVHGRVHAYTPARTVLAERRIREHVRAQLGDAWVPLEGALSLTVDAYRKLPRDLPRRLWASALPTGPPDVDNLVKLLIDSFTSDDWCVWRDDAQIVSISARKHYAVGRAPGWVVAVDHVPASLAASPAAAATAGGLSA